MVLAEIVNRGDVQGALRKNTHEIIRLNVDLYRRLSKMLGTEKSRKGVINEVEIVLKEESEICICLILKDSTGALACDFLEGGVTKMIYNISPYLPEYSNIYAQIGPGSYISLVANDNGGNFLKAFRDLNEQLSHVEKAFDA